jgi:hypothetical protein
VIKQKFQPESIAPGRPLAIPKSLQPKALAPPPAPATIFRQGLKYHTIKGKRAAFKKIDTKVASGTWHTLRVDFEGNRFVVTFDGKKVIEAADDSLVEAGKVGVWTKADSVTLFDDLSWSGK